MEQIDWSKVPEDATHWCDSVIVNWYKLIEGSLYYYSRSVGKWMPSDNDKSFIAKLVERPSAPQWSGEGIPPVGTDLEVKHGTYGWIGAKAVGVDGGAVIVRTNDGYAGVFSHELRAIRTAEQVASDNRMDGIKEIEREFSTTYSWMAGQIYDLVTRLGYRKP